MSFVLTQRRFQLVYTTLVTRLFSLFFVRNVSSSVCHSLVSDELLLSSSENSKRKKSTERRVEELTGKPLQFEVITSLL